MAKLQIKRGLQAGVQNLILDEGEMAVALDTGNVYVGTISGKVHVNPVGGTADEATKLKNPRNFSITGDVVATGVAFDGTTNVALTANLTDTGISAGSYGKVRVDSKGRVIGADQLIESDIPAISTGKVTGLGTAATKNVGTATGNLVVVGADGKIDASIIPQVAISDTFVVASQVEMLALVAEKGDIAIRTDLDTSFILQKSPANQLSNWKELITKQSVNSVNGKTGAVMLSAANVGAEEKLTGVVAKTNLIDGDTLIIQDSAVNKVTKSLSFSALKTTLKNYFDGLYNKYVHPTYTPKTAGLYKFTVDDTGHVYATASVVKGDITALGIPEQDTVYTLPVASATVAGGVKVGTGLLMSAGILSVGDIDGGTF